MLLSSATPRIPANAAACASSYSLPYCLPLDKGMYNNGVAGSGQDPEAQTLSSLRLSSGRSISLAPGPGIFCERMIPCPTGNIQQDFMRQLRGIVNELSAKIFFFFFPSKATHLDV